MKTPIPAFVLLTLAAALPARGQTPTAAAIQYSADSIVRLHHKAAGVAVGSWFVGPLDVRSEVESRTSPMLELFYQSGRSPRRVLEGGVSAWRWNLEARTAGTCPSCAPFQAGDYVSAYLIPAFVSVKLYPRSSPNARLEPYVLAGPAIALAVQMYSNGNAAGLYGSNAEAGLQAGIGARVGAGADYRLTPAWGISLGARYQAIRFFNAVAGRKSFNGPVLQGGLVHFIRR